MYLTIIRNNNRTETKRRLNEEYTVISRKGIDL